MHEPEIDVSSTYRKGKRPHQVQTLAADLLLVFKPKGHEESEHSHRHGQKLRVLRGALEIRRGQRRRVIDADSRVLVIAAGQMHRTIALEDTWLVAEALPLRKESK